MSKKPVPAKQTKETGPAGIASHSGRGESAMSNAEITSFVEKAISESLSKHTTQLQLETNQHLQGVSTELKRLSEEFQGVKKDQSQRIENVEKALSGLQQSYDQLGIQLKLEIERIAEEKVQLEAGRETFPSDGNRTGQLANRDAGPQEELSKLHQQHHQDMLSVINDCCRKLKSAFTRQHKPYDVSEIHAIIDDIEQKMISEILLEIQKTINHEGLGSFEEAFESVERTRGLGQTRDDDGKLTTLTTEDISAALETFENETFEKWSEELKPTQNTGAGESFEGPQEPMVEEVVSKSQGIITGDRGNLYYSEELKRAVDDIMSVAGNSETKKDDAVDFASDVTSNARNLQEIEASLDSIIVPDKTSDSQPKTKANDLPDLKSLEATIESDIAGLESSSEMFKNDLTSIDALIAADLGAELSSDAFTRDLLSLDAQIAAEQDKNNPPAPSSSKQDQLLKSFESKIATDTKISTGAKDNQLQSLEAQLESGVHKETSGKVKGDDTAKQTTPKEQVQASQSPSASAKPEKKPPTNESPAPSVAKDSAKSPTATKQ